LDNRLYNQHNHEKTAFFYLFECEKSEDTANGLFLFAFDWADKRGLDKIQGPHGFTALDGLGLLVKGFEFTPALGLPYNPEYYEELILKQGFQPVDDIISGFLGKDCAFPERIHELAGRTKERRGLSIASFKKRSELRAGISRMKDLYNEAITGTTGGIPITDEEIKALARQMLWIADPKLVKIVMKGDKAVGFLLAYPDISAALQKNNGRLLPFGWISLLLERRNTDRININGAGMAAEYRGLGGTAILYSELYKSLMENPRYQQVEVVQIGMENSRMQREMENFGMNFCKIHRTYQKELS